MNKVNAIMMSKNIKRRTAPLNLQLTAHLIGARKPPPECETPQPSVPCHSRQPSGGGKMTERRVRIDPQADLLQVECDHWSLYRRRQHTMKTALFGPGADHQRPVERPVGAFERQAVAIKNHQPVKRVLALFGRAFDLTHNQRLPAAHDHGVEAALV